MISKFRPLLLSVMALPAISGSHATLIGYEGFEFSANSMFNHETGSFWDYNNTAPGGAAPVGHTAKMSKWADAPGFSTTALASGGKLFTYDSGCIREYNGPELSDETAGAVNEFSHAKKVYYRITFNRGAAATWCGLSSFDFGAERLFFGLFPDGTGKFSIYDQNTFTRLALSTTDVNANQEYVIVAKLDYANDIVSLYVNPDLTQSEAANTPVASATYGATQWSTAVRVGSGGSGFVAWDDLAVATTWESLRTHEVVNCNETGAGSLRVMMGLARASGGRITFSPVLGSGYAATSTNRLIRFRRESPGAIQLDVPISGLQAGESIQGLTFRPGTAELFALGIVNPAGVNNTLGRLYRINPATGAATMVGGGPHTPFALQDDDTPASFGFTYRDGDVIYLSTWRNQQLLINTVSGSPQFTGPLFTWPGQTPSPSGSYLIGPIAQQRNAFGVALQNKLVGLSALNQQLVTIGNPEPTDGVLRNAPRLTLPAGVTGITGFAIADDGEAFAATSKLYRVDLRNGGMTEVGPIGAGTLQIRALAFAPARITVSTPLSVTGGRAFVVDAPATAPGITLAGNYSSFSSSLVEMSADASNGACVAFRNMNFSQGRGPSVGGAITSISTILTSLNMLSCERCSFFGNAAGSAGAIFTDHTHVTLKQCSITQNTGDDFGGASAIKCVDTRPTDFWGNFIMNHVTVTNNNSPGTASTKFPAIHLPGVKANLRNSIIADNANPGGRGTDVEFTSNIGVPPTVERCLIGNGSNTSLVATGANGNLIGTNAAPIPAHLAALGDYGGATRSRPPLPVSSALNLASGSTALSDQRGFTMNGVPDAGGTEFQGKSDLRKWWLSDWDEDGVTYGVEYAIGRNPNVAEQGPAMSIQRAAPGSPNYLLSVNNPPAGASSFLRWKVTKSYDLVTFPETCADYNHVANTRRAFAGFTLSGTNISFVPVPAQNHAFYRLEVEITP